MRTTSNAEEEDNLNAMNAVPNRKACWKVTIMIETFMIF